MFVCVYICSCRTTDIIAQLTALQFIDFIDVRYTAQHKLIKHSLYQLIDYMVQHIDTNHKNNIEQIKTVFVEPLKLFCTGQTDALQQVIIDTLWLYYHRHTHNTANNTTIDRFVSLCRTLYDVKVTDQLLFKLTLPDELLEKMNIYATDALNKAILRIRTSELYSQIKYNLWCEDSEGYSKLIVELVSYYNSNIQYTQQQCHALISHCKKLIGYFDLDPNRCIDIIIYMYSIYRMGHNNVQLFIGLIQLFNTDNVTQIIGFVLQSHTTNKSILDESYYHVIVMLIMYGIIQTKDVYSHMSPNDDWLNTARQSAVTDELQRAKQINLVSLTSTDDNKTDAKQPIRQQTMNNNNTIDLVDEPIIIPPEQQLGHVLSHTPVHNISLEHGATIHGTIDVITSEHNQKLQLLRWLLYYSAYQYAYILLSHLTSVMPCSDQCVGYAMIHYINTLIAPVYNSIESTPLKSIAAQTNSNINEQYNLSDQSTTSTVEQLYTWQSQQPEFNTESYNTQSQYHLALSTLFPLFEQLGAYLCNNSLLFTRLCALMVHVIKIDQQSQQPPTESTVPQPWIHNPQLSSQPLSPLIESYIKLIILPSFSLSTTTTALTFDLWSILSLLHYEQRYSIYGYWHYNLYSDTAVPELYTIQQYTINKTKYFRKRLSTNNLKEMARLLLKFSINNPTCVYDLLLQQVQSFDNMIIPVVESLKYQSKLNMDVVCWTLLQQLSSNKSKIKSDDINESHWYQSLCTFTGALFKRYPELQLQSFVQYCIHQLIQEQAVDVLLLKEILSQMSGIDQYEESSDHIIDSRAGGRLLLNETIHTKSIIKNKHRSIRYMLHSLVSDTTNKQQSCNNLLFPLYVLLCQLEYIKSQDAEIDDIRTTSSMVDKLHEVLIQYVDFIDTALVDNTQFIQYIPSIYDMMTTYHLSIEHTFYLSRRVLQYVRIHSIQPDPTHTTSTKLIPDVLVNTIQSLYSSTELWLSITPLLYTTFWSLSITNVYVPVQQYDALIAKYKQQLLQADKQHNNTIQNKDLDRMKSTLDKLMTEKTKQLQQYNTVINYCKQIREQYLDNIQNRSDTIQTIVTHCIIPRLLTSAVDAIYCAKFIQLMHTVNVPYFNLIWLYDSIIKAVSTIICSITYNESRRFSIFIIHMLTHINQLTSDQKYYESQCMNTYGFTRNTEHNHNKVPHKDIVVLVKRWYDRLCSMFVAVLTDGTPIQQSNILLVLTKINTQYPRYQSHNNQLEVCVNTMIQQHDKQSALKLMSTRVHAMLQQNKKSLIDDMGKSNEQSANTNNTVGNDTNKIPMGKSSSTNDITPAVNGNKGETTKSVVVDSKSSTPPATALPSRQQPQPSPTSTQPSIVSDTRRNNTNQTNIIAADKSAAATAATTAAATATATRQNKLINPTNTTIANNNNNISNRTVPSIPPAQLNRNDARVTSTPPVQINRTDSRSSDIRSYNKSTFDISTPSARTNDKPVNDIRTVSTQPQSTDIRRTDSRNNLQQPIINTRNNTVNTSDIRQSQPIRSSIDTTQQQHNRTISDDRTIVLGSVNRNITDDKHHGVKRGRQNDGNIPLSAPPSQQYNNTNRPRDNRLNDPSPQPQYNDNRRPLPHHQPQSSPEPHTNRRTKYPRR